ncbi:SusC/RagA family TonB-linked outer membrane protein [Aestuariibaculum sp. YM273]|uniref:SusC/RagA family TonB-linked outer membrane protein n=1 Tax=Aestuariibaculum sp. YM273 TaxID=3070659 RepID=UPI0027DE8CC6|nr:SusC/RagA family TonB-linked outer membrane protein [Aestuariibaculum sp. YM273]WMI64126.1 SusC/RagA family TonB-linked outer membrane protein [Aestuariibaculum sp. YM273]
MRTFILLFCTAVFSFSSGTLLSQNTKIIIDADKEITVDEVFELIMSQTDYKFIYRVDMFKGLPKVNVKKGVTSANELLGKSLSFSDFKINLSEDKNTIIIEENTITDQQFLLNGTVKNEQGMPLPGVTVLVKGTKNGTTTDFDGDYSLRVNESSIVVFSYVGYKTVEVSVDGKVKLDVVLLEDISTLEEVVITGVVERRKESFTGAVNTISGEDLREIGNQNIIQSIKTLDPSFIVLENNLQGSNPNVLPNIEVRGQTSISTDDLRDQFGADPNSPLFVLDGFETNLRTIVDLDMNRVASITILKDAASTALYGAKAANGVIVVETKRPTSGKMRLSYTGDFSVDMPDLRDYNLMNAAEKLEFERLSGRWTDYVNDPSRQVVLDSLYNLKLADVRRGVDTYWLNEPVQTAFTQKHAIYVDGGSDEMRFNAGLNYRNQEGVMKGSGRDTWGGNLDVTYRKGKLNITNRMYVSGSEANESPFGSFSNFAQANPYYKKRNEAGEITKYLETGASVRTANSYNVINPLYSSTLNNENNTTEFNIQNNLGMIWTLNSKLRFQGNVQLRKSTSDKEVFRSPQESVFDNMAFFEKGDYTNTEVDNFSYLANAMLVYHNVFAEKHILTTNLRTELEEQNNKSYRTVAVGFPETANGNPSFSFSYDPNAKPTYLTRKYRRNNIMGSLNYSFDNKYLLDANYRLDGSTAFGSNEKYSPFWSLGFGWNIHKELNMGSVVNLLRLRQTFGYTGNQSLGSVASTSVYTYSDLINYFGPGLGLTTYANPDLEWQRTFDMNLGLDIKLFNNRFDAQLNVYRKKTDPLVVPVNLASSTGLVAYPLNVGYLQVDGFEAIANYKIINNIENQFVWRIGATAAIVNMEYGGFGNTLQNLDEDALSSGSLRRYRDGGSPDDIWAVPSLGIDPATGREIFLKKNGQSTFDFDFEDEVVVGTSRPKVEGVLNNYINYKGFTLGLNVRYRFGGQSFNTALYEKVENIGTADIILNQDKRALYDRWQQPGDISKFKSIAISENTPISSRFVQDNDVLIGESFNLGYRVANKPWLDNLGMKSLRLTAYMNDIFRSGTILAERGIEYPFARNISFSINASF